MSNRRAFVIMPFRANLKWVLDEIIRPVCENLSLQVERGDEMTRHTSVMRGVVEGIVQSDVIIADLTGNNPNVFYELGAAHALLRPVVVMTQQIHKLPFDLAQHRVIAYTDTNDPAIKEALRSQLQAAVFAEMVTNWLPTSC